jgi:ABC-type transporter MlaC component
LEAPLALVWRREQGHKADRFDIQITIDANAGSLAALGVIGKVKKLVLAAGVCLAAPAAMAADAATLAFVDRINRTVESIDPGDRSAIRAGCASLVAATFDLETMAKSITGEAWSRMSAKHRAAYVDGLAKRAAGDCTRSGREIAGNLVELVGVRAAPDGDSNVAVRQSRGKQRTVIWRVRAGASGELKAVDMTVDGRSLATIARRDAKAILDNSHGDVTELVRSVGG